MGSLEHKPVPRVERAGQCLAYVSEGSQIIIGEGVWIGRCAVMEDWVIGDGALIGSNAVILNFAKVGKRALIASGSVVGTGKEIPPIRSTSARTISSLVPMGMR